MPVLGLMKSAPLISRGVAARATLAHSATNAQRSCVGEHVSLRIHEDPRPSPGRVVACKKHCDTAGFPYRACKHWALSQPIQSRNNSQEFVQAYTAAAAESMPKKTKVCVGTAEKAAKRMYRGDGISVRGKGGEKGRMLTSCLEQDFREMFLI